MTGKIVLNRSAIDLAECVRSSVAAVTAARSAEGRVRIAADPVWIHGDPVRVEQIIGNLVSNALKFTAPGQLVHVTVTTEADEAVLTVSDEGAGIDRELLPRIFDLFVQAAGLHRPLEGRAGHRSHAGAPPGRAARRTG